MNTTYHPEGNRDFRRWFESGVPSTGIIGSNLLYMTQMGKMGGYDKNIASALTREAMAADPRLKVNRISGMNQAFRNFGIKPPFDLNMMGASYNPTTNTVNVPKTGYGITAHELGHAEQYKNPLYRKTIAPLSRIGRAAGQLGVLAPILTDNEQEARRNSLIASAMQVPTLIEEVDASRRGSRLLTKELMKKPVAAGNQASKVASTLMKLRPFVGVPTYLLTAMAPYLIYKYMKGRGLYEGEY